MNTSNLEKLRTALCAIEDKDEYLVLIATPDKEDNQRTRILLAADRIKKCDAVDILIGCLCDIRNDAPRSN